MGKKIICILAGLALAVVFTCGASFAQEKVYVNGIDFGFPPFGFVDKDGKPAGFDVEAMDWIAKTMGFQVKHQPMDWDGIIPALNAGKIDLIASGMSITPERQEIVNFTNPYYQVTQVLVAQDDKQGTIEEWLTSGKKIGVQRGTVTCKYLEDLKKQDPDKYNYEIVLYDSTDLSMQDLPIGRIDGSGMDSSIAYELMKGKPYKVIGTFDAEPQDYGYAVRKEDTELLNTLNEGLKKLMADPHWQNLKAKYDIP